MLLFSKTLVCTGVKMPQWWTEEKESEPYLGSIFLVWCPLQSKKKSNHALLHSAQSLRNPALRYEITLYTTIHLYSPTSHSDTLCSSILPPVTEPSTASFLKGIHFRWANLAAGWISFIRAQHKGIRCNVPARFFFFRGSLCVLSGSTMAWADAFYLGAGEMIQILQNRIIAAGIAIPCQGFFASKSKKGLHKRNRLFCLLLYASLTAFRASKKMLPRQFDMLMWLYIVFLPSLYFRWMCLECMFDKICMLSNYVDGHLYGLGKEDDTTYSEGLRIPSTGW